MFKPVQTKAHKPTAKNPSKNPNNPHNPHNPKKPKELKKSPSLSTISRLITTTNRKTYGNHNPNLKDLGSIMDDWDTQASAHKRVLVQQQQLATPIQITPQGGKNRPKGKGSLKSDGRPLNEDDNGFFNLGGKVRNPNVNPAQEAKRYSKKQQELLASEKTIDLIRKMKPIEPLPSQDEINKNTQFDHGDNDQNDEFDSLVRPAAAHKREEIVISTKKGQKHVFDPTQDHDDVTFTPPTSDELHSHLKQLSRNFRDLSKSNEILHILGTFLGSFDLSPELSQSLQELSKKLGDYHNKFSIPYQLHLQNLVLDTLSLDNANPTQRLALLPPQTKESDRSNSNKKKGNKQNKNNNHEQEPPTPPPTKSNQPTHDYTRLSKQVQFVPGTKKASRGAYGTNYTQTDIRAGLHRVQNTKVRYSRTRPEQLENMDPDAPIPNGSIEIQSIVVPDRIVFNTMITALVKNINLAFPPASNNAPLIPSPSLHNKDAIISHPVSIAHQHKVKTFRQNRLEQQLLDQIKLQQEENRQQRLDNNESNLGNESNMGNIDEKTKLTDEDYDLLLKNPKLLTKRLNLLETDQTRVLQDLMNSFTLSGKDPSTSHNLLKKHKYEKGLESFIFKMTRKTPVESNEKLHEHPSVLLSLKLIDYMTEISSNPSILIDALIERQLTHFEKQVERVKRKKVILPGTSNAGINGDDDDDDDDDLSDDISDDLDFEAEFLGLNDFETNENTTKFIQKQKLKAKLKKQNTPFFPPDEEHDASFYSIYADKPDEEVDDDMGAELQPDMPLITVTDDVVAHLYAVADDTMPQMDTFTTLFKLAATHSDPILTRSLFLRLIQLDLIHISKLEAIMYTKQGDYEKATKIQNNLKQLQATILQGLSDKTPLSPIQYTQFMAFWDHLTQFSAIQRSSLLKSSPLPPPDKKQDPTFTRYHSSLLRTNPWLDWIFPAGVHTDGISTGLDFESILNFGPIDVKSWSNPTRLNPHKLPISPAVLKSALTSCAFPHFLETAFQSSERISTLLTVHQLTFKPYWVQLQLVEDLFKHQQRLIKNPTPNNDLPQDPRQPFPASLVPTTIGAQLPLPIPKRLDHIKNSLRFWISAQHIKSFGRLLSIQSYFSRSLIQLLRQYFLPNPLNTINNYVQTFSKTPKVLSYEYNNGEFDDSNGAGGGTVPVDFLTSLFHIADQVPHHSFAMSHTRFPDTVLLPESSKIVANVRNENDKKKKKVQDAVIVEEGSEGKEDDIDDIDDIDDQDYAHVVVDTSQNNQLLGLNEDGISEPASTRINHARQTLDAISSLLFIEGIITLHSQPQPTQRPVPVKRVSIDRYNKTATCNQDVIDAIPPLAFNTPLSTNPLIEQYLSHVPRVKLPAQLQNHFFGTPDGNHNFNNIFIDLGCGDGEHSISQAEISAVKATHNLENGLTGAQTKPDLVLACDILPHRLGNMINSYHKRRAHIPPVLSHSSDDSPIDLFTTIERNGFNAQSLRKIQNANKAKGTNLEEVPLNDGLTEPIIAVAQKLMTFPGASKNGIQYQECLNDVINLVQLHIDGSVDLIEQKDSQLFLGADLNNNNPKSTYRDEVMAKIQSIMDKYYTDDQSGVNNDDNNDDNNNNNRNLTPHNGIKIKFQIPVMPRSELLSLTTPRNLFQQSSAPNRVFTPSPFDYELHQEPHRSFQNPNLYGYCGTASAFLSSMPTATVSTINLTHPSPPTLDSYFAHHILDFKRDSLTDFNIQQQRFSSSLSSTEQKQISAVPVQGLLDPDSTLLSEHTLLLAARALKPQGSVFIISDDHRVATFLDRVLTPHQQSTDGCDRGVLELSSFFRFEELRLNNNSNNNNNHNNHNHNHNDKANSNLPSFMNENFSRYQKMNQQGKIPNQKPHSDGKKQRAWRLVRNDKAWD